MIAIVAVDEKWGIGKNNSLLFSVPEDMKFFRQTTTGKVIIVGRKTLESFPGAKPLKNRINVVLSSSKEFEGAVCVKNNDELFEEIKNGEYIDENFRRTMQFTSNSEKNTQFNLNANTEKKAEAGLSFSNKKATEEQHTKQEMRIFSINTVLNKMKQLLFYIRNLDIYILFSFHYQP